jgi:hypothetical protein
MLRITVSVQMGDNGVPIDLEIPAELPCDLLADLLAEALYGEPAVRATGTSYAISVLPSGQNLTGRTSLADNGIWDGVALILHPTAMPCFETDRNTQYMAPSNDFWIGRHTKNRAVAEDNLHLLDLSNEPQGGTVSRRHAQVKWQTNMWHIRAVPQAQNPVTVNARQLAPDEETTLQEGDEIQIGAVRLRFRLRTNSRQGNR